MVRENLITASSLCNTGHPEQTLQSYCFIYYTELIVHARACEMMLRKAEGATVRHVLLDKQMKNAVKKLRPNRQDITVTRFMLLSVYEQQKKARLHSLKC